MGINIESANDRLREKIVTYFGYVEEKFLKSVSATCAKIVIGERFGEICANRFDMPSFEEMEAVVMEELKRNFDRKVVHIVEETYPDMSDDELDSEMERLEAMYYEEHKTQINTVINAALEELRKRVTNLKKEIDALRNKYTI